MATLASEWTKLMSARSTYITLSLALVLSISFTGLIAAVIGANWDQRSPADQASFDPTWTSFFGSLFTTILFVVLSVRMVTAEYSSGMMLLTLTATPRRGRVFAAKLVAIALTTFVVGSIALLAMFAIGRVIFGAYGIDTPSAGDPDVLRVLLGASLSAPAMPLMAGALAFLMRSTAGAITTILGLIFAPSIFGPLLPEWWQKNVLRYLPGPAGDSLVIVDDDPNSFAYMDPWLGATVLVGWVALFCLAAYASFIKRDA